MQRILLVGAGGAIGSILRYLLSGYVQELTKSIGFPYGTLVVNVLGCAVIGFLSHVGDAWGLFNAESRAFVFVGLLGGFTTFSTFGNESLNLLREGETPSALTYVGAHVLFGLGAVWLGRNLAQWIWR
jgi:CrcB protein